jgi:hypothetical protein
MELRVGITPGKFSSWNENRYQVHRRLGDPHSWPGFLNDKNHFLLQKSYLLIFQSKAY